MKHLFLIILITIGTSIFAQPKKHPQKKQSSILVKELEFYPSEDTNCLPDCDITRQIQLTIDPDVQVQLYYYCPEMELPKFSFYKKLCTSNNQLQTNINKGIITVSVPDTIDANARLCVRAFGYAPIDIPIDQMQPDSIYPITLQAQTEQYVLCLNEEVFGNRLQDLKLQSNYKSVFYGHYYDGVAEPALSTYSINDFRWKIDLHDLYQHALTDSLCAIYLSHSDGKHSIQFHHWPEHVAPKFRKKLAEEWKWNAKLHCTNNYQIAIRIKSDCPDSTQAPHQFHLRKARQMEEKSQLEESLWHYDQALKTDSSCLTKRLRMDLLYSMGPDYYSKALHSINSLFNCSSCNRNRTMQMKARLLAKMERKPEAIACYDSLLKWQPNKPTILVEKAEQLADMGHEYYPQVMAIYDTMLHCQYCLTDMGDVLRRMGKAYYPKALACFEQTCPSYTATSEEVQLEKANLYRLVGRQYHQQALQIYDSVIAIYTHNNISKKELARAYNNKGLLLNYMGTQQSASTDCYNRALQCFNQAIGIQKDYDMAYGNKGMTCANIGRTKEKAQRKAFYTEALACYDKAIALSQGPLCAVWLVNKAIVLSYIGDNEQAMRYCDTAIATYPNHSEAYQVKASVLEHQGKRHYKMALNYYNQALALDPNDDWCYFMKAVLLKKMGKKHDPEILMCLDKALELASDVHIDEIQAYKDKYKGMVNY